MNKMDDGAGMADDEFDVLVVGAAVMVVESLTLSGGLAVSVPGELHPVSPTITNSAAPEPTWRRAIR